MVRCCRRVSICFPFEYTEELKELLDRVPPFPTEIAFGIVESELGRSVRDLYATIDSAPIAAASLGQVYRARLRTGEEVVVKVQRPDLESRIDLDNGNAPTFRAKTSGLGCAQGDGLEQDDRRVRCRSRR